MKSRNLARLVLLPIFLTVAIVHCSSREIRYEDSIQLLADNFWIDNHTLQIQVESTDDENIPYSWRRQKSCKDAASKIDDQFKKLYPGKNNLHYRKIIYKKLYTDKNNCRLVVHLELENLRDKLK